MAVREPPNVIREAGWLSESLPLSLQRRLGGCQKASQCHYRGDYVAVRKPPSIITEEAGWLSEIVPLSLQKRLGGC